MVSQRANKIQTNKSILFCLFFKNRRPKEGKNVFIFAHTWTVIVIVPNLLSLRAIDGKLLVFTMAMKQTKSSLNHNSIQHEQKWGKN